MRNFLSRIFEGRYGSYGSDKLTRFLIILAIILLMVSIAIEPLSFLYYLAFVDLAYCYFRLLSRNIDLRNKENRAFIGLLVFIYYFCPQINI